MATMKDIANRVGVSLTTVSNVVHGNYERVSPQTVQKILDAIQELHYVPNMSWPARWSAIPPASSPLSIPTARRKPTRETASRACCSPDLRVS